jgi:hypothetical protein
MERILGFKASLLSRSMYISQSSPGLLSLSFDGFKKELDELVPLAVPTEASAETTNHPPPRATAYVCSGVGQREEAGRSTPRRLQDEKGRLVETRVAADPNRGALELG